jgi:hypothetical protein
MRTTAQRRSNCPINIALEEFVDMWSLLIVRDLIKEKNLAAVRGEMGQEHPRE